MAGTSRKLSHSLKYAFNSEEDKFGRSEERFSAHLGALKISEDVIRSPSKHFDETTGCTPSNVGPNVHHKRPENARREEVPSNIGAKRLCELQNCCGDHDRCRQRVELAEGADAIRAESCREGGEVEQVRGHLEMRGEN